MIQHRIEINNRYITKMGVKVVLQHVGIFHPGSTVLHEASVNGLIIEKEAEGNTEQVAHYMEWNEFGCHSDSRYDLVEVKASVDDAIIDGFLGV